MPIIYYTIWFGDGSVSDNWDNSPDDNVQCVILYHPDGYKTILMGQDKYELLGSTKVKLGGYINTDKYEAIIRQALEQ